MKRKHQYIENNFKFEPDDQVLDNIKNEFYKCTVQEALDQEQQEFVQQKYLVQAFNQLTHTCMNLSSKIIDNVRITPKNIGITEDNNFKILPIAFQQKNQGGLQGNQKVSQFLKEKVLKNYIFQIAEFFDEIIQQNKDKIKYDQEFLEQLNDLMQGENGLIDILIAKFYEIDKENLICLEYHDLLKIQRNQSLKELFDHKIEKQNDIIIEDDQKSSKKDEIKQKQQEYNYFS
ncbi:hypothetical protein PPERSA_06948 [Pseudocohnilembus persalinus]|uniref:Uncharacterized protein n=1 Tax=Pseudocohnilembus persalinus TaxID=266149 RepID=A0A0V0QZK9_PSEPJ|nr:hypothetical protein PPERSA_06948 [Pseudocohnilembus persalinus]|eukprot:KRX07333.1 hypothetical protein PPERSA_06948 [Pseudocohnilembus persalinus]